MRFITVVSDQITQAFAVLGAEELSDETAGALVEAVAQFLSGVVGLENGLMGVCEKTGTKPIVARRGAHGLIAFMRGAVKNSLSSAEIIADLAELGLAKSKAAVVDAVFAKYRNQLLQAAIEATLTVNQLEDIDWRFGVTASSSEMDRVGSTFLQMKIKTADKPVSNIELSLEQFYHFLGEMEKAETTLKQLL